MAGLLAGCAQGRDAHLADQLQQQQRPEVAAGQNQLWAGNRGWLLAKLPRAAGSAQRVISVFNSYPDSKKLRASQFRKGDYDLLFDFMRGKLGEYRLQRTAESASHFALVEGDVAYLFDMNHLEFSGVANLEKGLFFAASDVPLERSDERSFAFVADGKTDTATSWTLYRRNILQQDHVAAQDLGTYSISGAELVGAGVAKQVDFLTPQQRAERELAQQGLLWRHRAEMKAVQLCGSQGARDGSKKQGGRGKRGGMGNRAPAGGGAAETSTEAVPGSENATTDPVSGQAKLNCRAGSGYLLTDDGISAEITSLPRSREGDPSPVVGSASKVITGATMRYRYAHDPAQGLSAWDQPGKEMVLEFKSADDSNKLSLNLRPDTGVSGASLVLPGEWYVGTGYKLSGRVLTRSEFGMLFMRAYRDCAIKDSQGACKSIPELFVSLLNAGMAQDLVGYLSEHYR